MMLNWKAMTLGQHARVLVTRESSETIESKIGGMSRVTRTSATVDARWNGTDLEVFGHGALWPEVEKVIETRLNPRRVRDGVHCVSYGDRTDLARCALWDFEAVVREMMRQPGWTVVEIPL